MNNMRKSAAVLAAGVLVVVAWSVWAKPQKTSSQPAPSANDQMISVSLGRVTANRMGREKAPMSELLPAIFFGHGNPMNALANNSYNEA